MKINYGDTAWVLTAAALVMFMTPGLALFYGGMVRAKNVLGMLMQNVFCLGLVSLLWAVAVYSLAFSGTGKLIGNFDLAWMRDVATTQPTGFALTIPPLAFLAFQLMFAVITPALITGAIADRMRWSAWVWFVGLWVVLVYAPVAHWVFSPAGWLFRRGALDFAGGTVVHISSGVSALAAALVIGKRKGYGHQPMPPHNLPFTVMGASLLWFGWFGFNAGSALAANGLAAHAFMTTNTATAAAALGWMFTEWSSRGKPTVLGAASGAVAGLVAITPAAGYVTPMAAIVIGTVAGIICYSACNLKSKLGYDDSLDVVGVHGVGGTWGALATGVFATKLVNDAGGDGLLYGNPKQLGIQLLAVVVTWVLGFVMTTVILKVLDGIMGLRVTDEEEAAGLDLSQHSETAYTLGGASAYSDARTGH